jgi:hypothetical protein
MAGDPRFLQALDELRALHLSKGHDYADAGDPLRNYQQSADDNNIPAWRAAQLRLSEKYHRLCNLTRGPERAPQHESLDDTLLDIAAIALIVRSLRAREATRDAGPATHQDTGLTGSVSVVVGPPPDYTSRWRFPPVLRPYAVIDDAAELAADGLQRWQHADPGDEAES